MHHFTTRHWLWLATSCYWRHSPTSNQEIAQTKKKLTWTLVWPQAFLRGALLMINSVFQENCSFKRSAQPPSEQGRIPAGWKFFTFLTFIFNWGLAHCLNQRTLKSEMLSTSEGSLLDRTYLTQHIWLTTVCGHAMLKTLGQVTRAVLLSPCIWNNKIRPFQMNNLNVYTFITVSAPDCLREI